GLELYEFHRYTLQSEKPPLARVIYAAMPWFGGMRFDPHGTFTDQIHSVFYDHGEYRANLFRGRAGTAVFFIIAAIAVFFAARDALGDAGALAATFLFTMEPVVLGYSALITHGVPAVHAVPCTAPAPPPRAHQPLAAVAGAGELRRPLREIADRHGRDGDVSFRSRGPNVVVVELPLRLRATEDHRPAVAVRVPT